MKVAIYISLIILLLLFCAFFAMADTVYTTVNKLRLEKASKAGSKAAKKALKLTDQYERTIATILFGNDLASLIAPAIGTLLAYQLWRADNPMGPTYMSVILILSVLLFGEIVPKAFGKIYSYQLSLAFVYPIAFFEAIFFPFVFITSKVAFFLAKPFASKAAMEDEVSSDEMLFSMIDEIEDEGIIDESKSVLLQRSIEFKDTTVEEIMTPRVDIVGYNTEHDFSSWVKEPDALRHSRIIVYNQFFDRIIGYIPTKALLKKMLENEKKLDYKSLLLPILSVPSTMEVSSVLKLMKKSHHHIAVVKDEYGGTDGILTLEDILEELVGELYDESETIHLDVVPTKKRNLFLVSGKMGIHDFFDRFNMDQDGVDEDYNTVSGWVNDKLGRFAVVGDSFSYGRVDVEVKKVTEYTVKELEVRYHPRRKIKED